MKTKISYNSIGFKLVLGFLLLTIPIIIFLIYSNNHAKNIVREEVAESNKKMVSLYMETIDSNLETVEEYLLNFAAFDNDVQQLEYFLSEKDYALAKIRMQDKISDHILMFDSVESIFLYSNHTEDFTEAFKLDSAPYEDREKARNYMRQVVQEEGWEINEKGWHLKTVEGDYYLFRFIKTTGTVVGAWLKLETLLTPLHLIDFGEVGTSFFVTATDEAVGVPSNVLEENSIDLTSGLEDYFLTGNEDAFLVVGQPSTTANFSLVALIPDEKITENFQPLNRFATFIILGSVILIPIGLFLLNKTVLSPLARIVHAMRRIGGGNLDVRIHPYQTSEEFQLVNKTFNKMMDQIQDLKIDIYEERILTQKAELQYLQYQINPHFFMNTLNIIFSLAQLKKYELVQDMALCLVRYFRYTLVANRDFVHLKDELMHVTNYLRIQELRFPESFTYQIIVEDRLSDAELPPVVIQTFVENVIKYAVNMDQQIMLTIKVESVDETDIENMKITVQDTGDGFPEKILKDINADKWTGGEKGDHIGIWNAQRRLQLLYQERAKIYIKNAIPSGAVIEIILPVKQQ